MFFVWISLYLSFPIMVPSNLLLLLFLPGWSVGASPTSTTKSSAVQQQTSNTIGNQLLPDLATGVTDVTGQSSPSPTVKNDEKGTDGSPTASPAEPTEPPSTTTDDAAATGNSNLPENPLPQLLGGGGSSKISDGGSQAAQTADQTSQSPTSTSSNTDSGGLLGDLPKYLDGAGGLLSPSLLPDLEEVVHDAAYLLKAPTTKDTKVLLGSAFDLLNPDSVKKITSAVHTAQGIITPEVVDELKKVHLAEVFGDIGSLWTQGKGVLDHAKGLVSGNVIKNVEDIIESVKKLLSGETSERDIQDALDKLEGALPPEVTNSVKTVVSSIGPFVDKAKPLFNRVENYLSHADYDRLGEVANNVGDLIGAAATVITPENIKKAESAVDKAKPYIGKIENYLSHVNWDRVGNLVTGVEDLVGAISSALTPETVKKIEDTADKVKPYVEKAFDQLSHANWDRLGDLINNVEDLVGTISAAITPERIEKGKNAFNNAKGYFSQNNMDKARDLGRSVWSKLTPEGINRASDLVSNAEALLAAAAPLVTPESLDHGKDLYSKAKSYFPPDSVDRLKDASHKLGILYNSIAPGITPPTMDKLGELVDAAILLLTPQFANETNSLIGTASGILTPQLVDQVDGYVDSLEKMFTPDVRNDTKNAIGSAAHVRLS